jgi:hypothetical protein
MSVVSTGINAIPTKSEQARKRHYALAAISTGSRSHQKETWQKPGKNQKVRRHNCTCSSVICRSCRGVTRANDSVVARVPELLWLCAGSPSLHAQSVPRGAWRILRHGPDIWTARPSELRRFSLLKVSNLGWLSRVSHFGTVESEQRGIAMKGARR